MLISVPEVEKTLEMLLAVESTFEGRTQPISSWVMEHQNEIKRNRNLLAERSDTSDIVVLNIFLRDLLIRAIKGEIGQRVYRELTSTIKTKMDLHEANYRLILENSNYRWGVDDGSSVISSVVNCLDTELHWDWAAYIKSAEEKRRNNYQDDPLLRIKNISYKLRDLALSNFSPYYAAFDLHVTRVLTRMGWLNYGFSLVNDADLEMGNNPGSEKNYRFLHGLFILLSNMTKGKYSPVDLDRIFWHVGRSKCGAKTKCHSCPVKAECPTGKHRTT